MSIWTNHPNKSDADLADSLSNSPSGGPVKMWFAGVGVALVPIVYGVRCLFTGRAWFPGQHGSSLEVAGPTAFAMAIAYIAVGAFLHFHYFWGLHPRLCGVSPLLKAFAILVLLGSFGYAGYLLIR